MSDITRRCLYEIKIRKNDLEIKQQIQDAVNDKELEMLMLWERSLEQIIEEDEKGEKDE